VETKDSQRRSSHSRTPIGEKWIRIALMNVHLPALSLRKFRRLIQSKAIPVTGSGGM
jgi:hypothetical protein